MCEEGRLKIQDEEMHLIPSKFPIFKKSWYVQNGKKLIKSAKEKIFYY
jgi:hypothetical protein